MCFMFPRTNCSGDFLTPGVLTSITGTGIESKVPSGTSTDLPKNALHPTMKPVSLCAYPIQNSSMSNCIVLDPFGGSGSTLMACEQTNRICYTIELDEKYADAIVKRYIEHVGTDANVLLERGGEKLTYSDVPKPMTKYYR